MVGVYAILILSLVTGCTKGLPSNPESGVRGRTLYGEFCQSCHGDAVTGDQAIPGAPPHGPQGHTWHHEDGQLEAIFLGEFDYPGRAMPAFQGVLTEEDVRAILAYLKRRLEPGATGPPDRG